jgi:hypothetical protein
MRRFQDGVELNPKLALSIGFIAVQWARIEFTTQRICIGVLEAKAPPGLMLTASIGNRTILDFLRSVAVSTAANHKRFAGDLTVICDEFQRLLGLRNSIVHNTWPRTKSKKRFVALVARFKGKPRLHEEAWSPAQIQRVATDCLELLATLEWFAVKYDLLKPMNDWQPSSREKPPPLSSPVIPRRSPKFVKLLRRAPTSQA